MLRRRFLSAFLGPVFALFLASPGVARAADTVVSFTFDDGIESQFQQARPQLIKHGMLATFYINSGTPGTIPYYMSWAQIDQLNAERNEIGGHTIDHARLSGTGAVSPAEARRQICVDAANLRARGYQILDFAYPYGAGATTGYVRQALMDCGYVSARRYGNLRGPDCTALDCPLAENIPPDDNLAVNSSGAQAGPLTLTLLQHWVEQAEDDDGGWVPIVFHEIDNSGMPSTVSPATFATFLDWLAPRQAIGTTVKTVRSVMGFPDPPPPPPPEPPKPVTAFPVAKDSATAFASLKVPKRQRLRSLRVSAVMAEPGIVSAVGTVPLGKRYRLKKVRAAASPGRAVILRLSLTSKGIRAVNRALRRGKVVKALISIKATDAFGNHAVTNRAITLRP